MFLLNLRGGGRRLQHCYHDAPFWATAGSHTVEVADEGPIDALPPGWTIRFDKRPICPKCSGDYQREVSISKLKPVLVMLALLLLSPKAYATVGPGDRVVMMGDSQAFMLTRPMRALARGANISFEAEPVAGSSVIQWSLELERNWGRIHALRPTVLLVALGSNDVCIGKRVVQNEGPYFDRFSRRLKRVHAREIWWIGPPNIGGKHKLFQARDAYDPFLRWIRTKIGYATLLDSRERFWEMLDDELHPSIEGARQWASWIWSNVTGQEEVDGG